MPKPRTMITRNLISDQVFRTMLDGILSGRYEPHEKLPTQRAIAAELRVNMASVREAVKRLEQMRLIEVRQGDAMRVLDWRSHGGLEVVAHVLVRGGALDLRTLRDLLRVRAALLGEIARLAASNRTRESAARLVALAREIGAAESDEAAQEADWRFFAEMTYAADNVVLRLAMNTIRSIYFEHAEMFRPIVSRAADLIPLYESLAEAIGNRDSEAAGEAARELAELQGRRLADRFAAPADGDNDAGRSKAMAGDELAAGERLASGGVRSEGA